MPLNGMGLVESAEAIRDGQAKSVDLVTDSLSRIRELEDSIGAWAYLNEKGAMAAAETCDHMRRTGAPLGALHGVPVAVKDIIDTAHMPTEYGSVLYAGRVPVEDAVVVARLRQAGAIIMGKTVTAELASGGPGKTRNPHNPDHTPGGSSSGSAAAVAAFMVPGALGTQTSGSLIRPASYCGIYGFKPTYGLIPRTGVLMQSFSHDQVGTFARSIDDIAILTDILIGPHAGDEATSPIAGPGNLSRTAASDPPMDIRLAFVTSHLRDHAEPATQAAFDELQEALGSSADDVDLPEDFDHAIPWHHTVVEAECAEAYAREYAAGNGKIHECLRSQIERGREIRATAFLSALRKRKHLNALLSPLFDQYDAIVTFATTGEAPRGLESTGDPVFCATWSFCGTPSVSLPLMQGESGLPLGVQLVGRRGDDARLLRTANWLVETLASG